MAKTSNELDVTGTANARATVVPLTAAAMYAQAARGRFNEARAALERGLVLRETATTTSIAALESAMADMRQQMKMLATAGRPGLADAARKATGLAQDWQQAGLKIIKPSAEGLLELPTTTTVAIKADLTAAALDELVEQANAATPPRSAVPLKRRIHASSRPAAAGVDMIAASGAQQTRLH
jgi:hypothetical protein